MNLIKTCSSNGWINIFKGGYNPLLFHDFLMIKINKEWGWKALFWNKTGAVAKMTYDIIILLYIKYSKLFVSLCNRFSIIN